jgi:hypothetical protein
VERYALFHHTRGTNIPSNEREGTDVCACSDLRCQASEGVPWQGAMVSYAVIVNLQVCVILFKLLANTFIVYDC